VFDENEFLSPFGVRSLSKVHASKPFTVATDGAIHSVEYTPGESTTGMFGGNSNWRGPIWFPMNYLLIESLEAYHHFYGDSFLVEVPAGSGNKVTLKEAARELQRRLSPTRADAGPATATIHATRRTPRSTSWCCSTSTSTATPDSVSAPAIRRVGRRSRSTASRTQRDTANSYFFSQVRMRSA
jgi:hypothetical protein